MGKPYPSELLDFDSGGGNWLIVSVVCGDSVSIMPCIGVYVCHIVVFLVWKKEGAKL